MAKKVYVVVCATGNIEVFDSLDKASAYVDSLADFYESDFYRDATIYDCDVK